MSMQKQINPRVLFPVVVLMAALFLLFIPYAYWFGGSYGLVDDFSFIVMGPLPKVGQWLSIGRPGTFYYMDFVAKVLHGDLAFARLMGLLLVALCSLMIYACMRYRGHVAALAVAAALAIPASYAVHLSIVWINTGSSLVSLILAALAYGVGYSNRWRILAALVLFTISGLVYQPTACIFFVFHMLDWLLIRRERMRVADLWPFAIGAFGLAIIFGVIKVTAALIPVDPAWVNRGAFLYDVQAKLDFLWDLVLPFAASPIILPTWYSVLPAYAGLAGMLILAVRRDIKRREFLGILLTIGVAFIYLVSAEIPILIVNDSWASTRTLVPWIMLSTFSAAWVIYATLFRVLGERTVIALIAIAMVGIGWWNGLATKRHLIDPAKVEMNFVTSEVLKGVSAGHSEFAMIMPPPGAFDMRFGQYEFGWFSSAYSWTPRGMLIMAQRRLALPEKSLKLVKTSRYDINDCACYVIDMRPLWNEYRERFKLPPEEQRQQTTR